MSVASYRSVCQLNCQLSELNLLFELSECLSFYISFASYSVNKGNDEEF